MSRIKQRLYTYEDFRFKNGHWGIVTFPGGSSTVYHSHMGYSPKTLEEIIIKAKQQKIRKI